MQGTETEDLLMQSDDGLVGKPAVKGVGRHVLRGGVVILLAGALVSAFTWGSHSLVADAESAIGLGATYRVIQKGNSLEYNIPGLVPEGVATLPNGDYLVSSVGGKGVRRIRMGDEKAKFSRFTKKKKGIMCSYGVHVDEARKRVIVTDTAPITVSLTPNSDKKAGIYVYDYKGKEQCHAVFGGDGAFPNDVTVGQDGTIYTTCSYSGNIWKTSPDCKKSEILVTLPMAGTAGKTWGDSNRTNGIDVLPPVKGKPDQLVVTVIPQGLFKVNTEDKSFKMVEGEGEFTKWIDGFHISDAGTAYGLRFGAGFDDVVKFTTDDEFESVVGEPSNPLVCTRPTTLTENGHSEIWVTCNEGFGAGPYYLEKALFHDQPEAVVKTSIQYYWPGLVPEGVATLPNGDFLVGSVGGKGVGRIHYADDIGSATVKPFVKPKKGMMNSYGVHVDQGVKRVYVTDTPTITVALTPVLDKKAGIYVYDFKGKEQCHAVFGGDGAFPNDVTVGQDGTIYTTCSYSGNIWKTSPDCKKSEILVTLPMAGTAGKTWGASNRTNGIDVLPPVKGKPDQLVVTVIPQGLFKVNTEDKSFKQIAGRDEFTNWIDGFHITNPNTAFGVRFGDGYNDVVRFDTDDDWESVEGQPSKGLSCTRPTTLTVKDDEAAEDSVWVSCNEGFGQGPYYLEKAVF